LFGVQVEEMLPSGETSYLVNLQCHDSGSPTLAIEEILLIEVHENPDIPKTLRFHGDRIIDENQPASILGSVHLENLITGAHIQGVKLNLCSIRYS